VLHIEYDWRLMPRLTLPVHGCGGRFRIQGFIVWDFQEQWEDFVREVGRACSVPRCPMPLS
jgi:hypothetical protein